ncbi:ABC transporter substrate-binding protein [Oecophyllibacter saccharovorans]|nr:ABC transporter substrate-binding protein [Oecophyllibacter saccharovorans]
MSKRISPPFSALLTPASRRSFLRRSAIGLGSMLGAGALGLSGMERSVFAGGSAQAAGTGEEATGPLEEVHLAWDQVEVCQAPISVALQRGMFARYGLDVKPIKFTGSTDQLLQAIATGKADGGIGMALRWLKPLEQGFDVVLTVGTHGGCMRLLSAPDSGITSVADLKGKKVAVTDAASPVRNYFSIRAAKLGINPETEIEWLQFPADLFSQALKKGEVQAIAGNDPQAYIQWKRDGLVQVATNLDGPDKHAVCCVMGLGGHFWRDRPKVAIALSKAIIEAQAWTAAHPDEAAKIFAPYVPGNVPVETIAAILRSQTHELHSTGALLRQEIATFVNDLKLIHVINPTTNTQAFVDKIVVDVPA